MPTSTLPETPIVTVDPEGQQWISRTFFGPSSDDGEQSWFSWFWHYSWRRQPPCWSLPDISPLLASSFPRIPRLPRTHSLAASSRLCVCSRMPTWLTRERSCDKSSTICPLSRHRATWPSRSTRASLQDTVIIVLTVTDDDAAQAQEIAQSTVEALSTFVEELETPRGTSRPTIKASIIDPASLNTSAVNPNIPLNAGGGTRVGTVDRRQCRSCQRDTGHDSEHGGGRGVDLVGTRDGKRDVRLLPWQSHPPPPPLGRSQCDLRTFGCSGPT